MKLSLLDRSPRCALGLFVAVVIALVPNALAAEGLRDHGRPRFGGRVVMVDVGMLVSLGGNLAALELRPGGSLTAIYPTGRQAIERKAADPKKPRGPRVVRAVSL